VLRRYFTARPWSYGILPGVTKSNAVLADSDPGAFPLVIAGRKMAWLAFAIAIR
jgi:hypothetical protein